MTSHRLGGAAAVLVTVLVTALLLALVAVGCGANTHPDTRVVKAGEVYVAMETEAYTADSVGGMGIRGTLSLVDGCVGFGPPGHEVVAVFPPGTSVTGTGSGVVMHVQGRRLRLGEEFSGSTRAGDHPLSSYGDLGTQAPKACRAHHGVDISLDD